MEKGLSRPRSGRTKGQASTRRRDGGMGSRLYKSTLHRGRIADTDADPGDSEDSGLMEPGSSAMPTLNRGSSGKRVGDVMLV